MRALLLSLVLALAACGGTEPPLELGDLLSDGGADGGLKPFGAPRAGGAECESDVCFVGGNRSFCSMHCTEATQATDCPKPPTSGTCNLQGYGKP